MRVLEMKNNQFAIQPVTLEQEMSELKAIDFLADNYQEYLEKCFPQVKGQSAKRQKIKSLRANQTQDLLMYLEENETVEVEVFYTVALQLLGFLEIVDFTFGKVFEAMEKIQLPFIKTEKTHFETSEELSHAWYMLLTTHSKFGLNFLDSLASKGYFKDFPKDKPLFFNGKALPIFEGHQFIREVVYVETNLDTDQDGKCDLVKVEIIRPRTQVKIPALFTASPYNQGINPEANDRKLHEVKRPIARKVPNETTYEEIRFKQKEEGLPNKRVIVSQTSEADETFSHEQSYTLNDFFLTRGFASVYATGIGGLESDGIMTCGSVEQTDSMKAVVEWLAGNRVAFTNKTDNIAIKADWCNKKVAMTGKSYLGTLASAVATTGVIGLETIVSEAAISNWYQYYRENGLVIAPGGYPGEDADVLAELTFSRMIQAGDYLHIKDFFNEKQAEMKDLQDRENGSYNTFWDERNYLPNVHNIKADIIMVHGLNDWNVKPRHVQQLWEKLRTVDVEKKIILHQGEHIYINNQRSIDFSDMMNLWFSYKLYDLENQANKLLPNVVWQDNTESETWHAYAEWLSEKTRTFYLNEGKLSEEKTVGEQFFKDDLPQETFDKYANTHNLFDKEIQNETNTDLKGNRLLFQSDELTEEIFLDGVPKVKLRVKSSKNFGLLSVRLVDYGKAKRLGQVPKTLALKAIDTGYLYKRDDLKEFDYAPETMNKMISIGHTNLQNRKNAWKNDDLQADEYVEVIIDLQPTIYRLPKGRKLGLIVYATDYDLTLQGNEKMSYTVDLAESELVLPIRVS